MSGVWLLQLKHPFTTPTDVLNLSAFESLANVVSSAREQSVCSKRTMHFNVSSISRATPCTPDPQQAATSRLVLLSNDLNERVGLWAMAAAGWSSVTALLKQGMPHDEPPRRRHVRR